MSDIYRVWHFIDGVQTPVFSVYAHNLAKISDDLKTAIDTFCGQESVTYLGHHDFQNGRMYIFVDGE